VEVSTLARVSLYVVSLTAAIGGCSGSPPLGHEPTSPQLERSSRDDQRTNETAPVNAGAAGAGPIGVAGIATPEYRDGADVECPVELPIVGASCRGAAVCTYRRDGPCGAIPDQIRICQQGAWVASAPAIACPGTFPAIDCTAPTLDQYCSAQQCPINLYQARSLACGGASWLRPSEQSNQCGGISVRLLAGLGGSIYHYDATKTLVGIAQFNDVSGPPCYKTEYVYGRDCLPDALFCQESACTPPVCDMGADDDVDAGAQ
jgi:hypothetical protein